MITQEKTAAVTIKISDTAEITITPREIEIVQDLAEGLSAKEIAVKQCCSKRTVDFHQSNLYRKLGVNKGIKALLMLQKYGVITV